MARFVEIGNGAYNLDHVVSVVRRNGVYMANLVDGDSFYVSRYEYDSILGRNKIKNIVKPEDVSAFFNVKKNEESAEMIRPVSMLGITYSGDVRPLDFNSEFVDFMDHCNEFAFLFEGELPPLDEEEI